MEPHCAFKVAKYLLKNINCYQLKANDRFGLKLLLYLNFCKCLNDVTCLNIIAVDE